MSCAKTYFYQTFTRTPKAIKIKKGDEKHEKYEKGREEKERNKLNQSEKIYFKGFRPWRLSVVGITEA